MDIPVVYYVNLGFSWFIVLLAIAGYFYISKETGKKWSFWPIIAAGWAMFGISHVLVVSDVSTSEWYMTLLRILGYVLVIAALCTLAVETIASKAKRKPKKSK
jgi:hypothetical protein